MKHLGRLLFAVLLCAGFLKPNVHTLATITGTGATVQISTDTTTQVAWIQVITPCSTAFCNSANVMFGDSTVNATTGLPVAPGGGYNTPVCSTCSYTLAAHYVYVANGDKAYIAFGDK